MSKFNSFFNPLKWIKAIQYHKQSGRFDKSTYDLELYLYSQILTNDMLHYGYFDDTDVPCEAISLKQIEEAQIRYAEKIAGSVVDEKNGILDVGCGMGGLSKLLHDKGLSVESLTPNKNQIDYINRKYPYLRTYQCKFEKFHADKGKQYGTVINSESFQYIAMDDAFKKMDEILLPGGRWIIVDYFRVNETGINKSSHLLEDFRQKAEAAHWKLIEEEDITFNVLPTIAYVNMYARRFLLPLKQYAYEKIRFKKPWLYFMTDELREQADQKIEKSRAAVDPEKFVREKKYLFMVLEKQSG